MKLKPFYQQDSAAGLRTAVPRKVKKAGGTGSAGPLSCLSPLFVEGPAHGIEEYFYYFLKQFC